ncbi:hypothetical protein JCM30237_12820 [Halolamina litorea]
MLPIPVDPLQGTISETISQTIADVIEFLPTVLGVLLILVVGYIVGRILGGLVTRVVRGLGVDRYSEGTAVENVGGRDSIARGLGMLVSYYVYFVAIVAAADVLDIDMLTGLLTDLGAYLPVLLGALIVLVLGFVIGRFVGDVVADIVGGFAVGKYLSGTPLERMGDQEGEFGRLVGTAVAYYIYLLTLLAVADILNVGALSTFLDEVVAYLPALVGGLIVLLVGIWVAERVADLVADAGDSRATDLAAVAVKVFIYYLAVTIALATIGFEITLLTNLFTGFVVAFFGALALALAIGIGIAVGLGGQEYVAENIDGWMSRVADSTGTDSLADTDSSEGDDTDSAGDGDSFGRE